MRLILVGVCFFFFSISAESQSLDQLNKLDHYNKATNVANRLEAMIASRADATKFACLKAFGRPTFCNCLSQNLPVLIPFTDYIVIVTQSKEENGYSHLSSDVKAAYDEVPAVRERCVKQDAHSP